MFFSVFFVAEPGLVFSILVSCNIGMFGDYGTKIRSSSSSLRGRRLLLLHASDVEDDHEEYPASFCLVYTFSGVKNYSRVLGVLAKVTATCVL